MAEQILLEYKKDIAEFTLVPSDGGRFELALDGNPIFSKKTTGRYPDYDEIKTAIDAR